MLVQYPAYSIKQTGLCPFSQNIHVTVEVHHATPLQPLRTCTVVLQHCATSRRVPGSIPGHWGFFPGHQTVPCALGSTQSLKMSNRIFLGVKTAGA